MFEDIFAKLSKTKKIILKICLIGVFSALSFVGTMIKIPIPSPIGEPMIHLGNLVVVLSALLFGGIIGGLSGSIGMGFYDIYHGYDPVSIIRTIILKFIMGLIVGFVYLLLNKKEYKKGNAILIIIGSLFILMGLFFLKIAIFDKGILMVGTTKPVGISPLLYIFSLIIGIFLLFVGVFSNKLEIRLKYASIATSLAMVVNILGEFIYKVLKQSFMYSSEFMYSVCIGIAGIPATVINAVITLIIILLVFIPIEEAVRKSINK